ncbi:MAG TPA: hypothetical protein VIJ50_14200 [Solirubrobacteraceae bacterium]
MSDESSQTDGSKRLKITEADLETPPSQAVPAGEGAQSARSTSPSGPSDAPEARPFAPRAEGGADQGWTEATRLMCTAAYLDPTFAQDVVDEVVHERHRAISVPTGVDIATVAKHCLAACRQKTVRDGLLMLDVIATIILFFVSRGSFLWLLLGFLLGWAIVLWDTFSATYFVIKHLNPRDFAEHQAPTPTDRGLVLRIDELARDQRGNLTIYSGFMPFAAAGLNVGGWSFLIDLCKGRNDMFGDRSTPSELKVTDLYSEVASALATLEMSNMEIRDRLFVSGSDVRNDPQLLSDPLGAPPAWVELDVLSRYMISPTHQVRHYRCIEIVDWRGELVVSLFLRFAISNGRLFCELNKFVLVPLEEELHRLDHMGGGIRPGELLRTIARSAAATPGLSLRAPKVLFRPVSRDMESSNAARQVARDPFHDYGAPVTALDRVRSTRYRRYFQRLDKDMYDKFLERSVLDSLVTVLERHGIDTGELVERSATIINNGVMAKEANISGHNVAVGQSSKILDAIPRPGGGSESGAPPVGAKP